MSCEICTRSERRDNLLLAGVGVGPANLSLSAMISELAELIPADAAQFFHDQEKISWHSGQLLPDATMLSEFYWDLVTPINPRSRYTFLAYVHANGRLAEFLNSGILQPSREEFQDYLCWVARNIANIEFGAVVKRVSYCPDIGMFHLEVQKGPNLRVVDAKFVSLGIGRSTRGDLPTSDRVISVSQLADKLDHIRSLSPRNIAIVGAGQSAAEAVDFVWNEIDIDRDIDWICPDPTPSDINTSSFHFEYFLDSGISAQHALFEQGSIAKKFGLTAGVDPSLSRRLLQRRYNERAMDRASFQIRGDFTVTKIVFDSSGRPILCSESSNSASAPYDLVILATGRNDGWDDLKVLLDDPTWERLKNIKVDRNFRYSFGEGRSAAIFLQSLNCTTHGETDANFVTAPFRNLRIIESMLDISSSDIQDHWS